MAPNDAMLFLLPVAQQARFYMRNTLVPLSCAYMDDEGVILETHYMKPTGAPARFEDYWQGCLTRIAYPQRLAVA
jgi:uncharacterized membrane protein (UPF0127 family)